MTQPIYDILFSITRATPAVTPKAPQPAGCYGDNGVARVQFVLDDITSAAEHLFRIEAVDGNGAYDITERLSLSGNAVTYIIPAAWTAAGVATLRLVEIEIAADGSDETVLHYPPVYLRFEGREEGTAMGEQLPAWQRVMTETENAAQLAVDSARQAADATADTHAAGKAALQAADQARVAATLAGDAVQTVHNTLPNIRSGNWYLGDTPTGVPAVGPKGEQGVQGPKGDRGEKGEKGDTGEVTAAEYEQGKAELQGKIDATQKQISTAAEKTTILEKRIVNLEQGITPSPFNTDSTVAYQKDVPENALPYAEVSKVGGMTRKCTNLWKFGDLDFTRRATLTFDEPLPAGVYTFSANVTSTDTDATYSLVTFNTCGVDGANIYAYFNHGVSNVFTFEVVNPLSIIYINASSTLTNSEGDNATFTNIMLNVGTTALPHEPYFEGLRSAPVTEVESVGANLLPYPYTQNSVSLNGVKFTVNVDGGITGEGIPTNPTWIVLYQGKPLWKGLLKSKFYGTYSNMVIRCAVYTDRTCNVQLANSTDLYYGMDTSNLPDDCWMVLALYRAVNGVEVSGTVYPIIYNGNLYEGVFPPYSPYVRNTLPIPTEVQALDGYGEGVNESVYNYIDWEKKQFVKRVSKVDMGALNWKTGSVWYATISGRKTGYTNVLCGKYKNAGEASVNSMGEGTILGNGTLEIIYVKDNSYPDVDTFKSAMSGVMLYYELATPVVTDISHILSEDNFIGVEGNGTVTLKNEYSYDVPSEITYQIKEVTV